MKYLLALILGGTACASEQKSIVDDALLHNIAIIESNLNDQAVGRNGEAGAFQLKHSAWVDGIAYLRTHGYPYLDESNYRIKAFDFDTSAKVAWGLLKWYESRLLAANIKPTPLRLYMAYNMGFAGAMQYDFNPANERLTHQRRAIMRRAYNILSR
jgi:hypothetical protein